MFDSRIEAPGRGIVSEPECGLPAWVYQGGGAMEQHEAECLNRLEHRQCGVLARPSPSLCPGLDLKIRQQVVRENHQLLPRTVSGICHCRHCVKRQAALELTDGLFMIDLHRNRRAILSTPQQSLHVYVACVNALPIDIRFYDIQGPYDVQWA